MCFSISCLFFFFKQKTAYEISCSLVGSDSHTAFTLGEFTECRKILDAVDFPEERILNVSPRRLLNFLESRGMPAIPEFADL